MKDIELLLIRHAKKSDRYEYKLINNNLLIDKLRPLSNQGHCQARIISQLPVLSDVDEVYSSDYTRTMETALYLAERRNLKVNVDSRFGERIKTWKLAYTIPAGFRYKQLSDPEYRLDGGESRKMVFERFCDGVTDILYHTDNRKIAVFSHKNAITMYLMNWCDYDVYKDVVRFKGEIIINPTAWDGSPEIFSIRINELGVQCVERIDNQCNSIASALKTDKEGIQSF